MVDLLISATVFENKIISAITSINSSDDKIIEDNSDNAMVIYFASKGEKLWDIAKKYLSSTDDIKTVNELSEDILSDNITLLIPIE